MCYFAFRIILSTLLLTLPVFIYSNDNLVRDFALYKLNANDKSAPTLLLMGGIHGDEAGAYYTTDIFIRHYRITKGSVWVVPVVNPHGMFANKRGVYGDMNRKFATLSLDDPDYTSIQKIKSLLADPNIDISMHLHDGSGYWRPTYVNNLLNPYRWGNCSVIDQPELNGAKYGNLETFVTQMVADINAHILNPLHRYHVYNTQTKTKNDTEQLRALTFFSLSLGKPALTNEASKELDIPTRVFYHLLAIESLLGQLGIGFERNFMLNVDTIKTLLSPKSLEIKIENHITLPLDSLRPYITYFPFPKDTSLKLLNIESQSTLFGFLSLDKRKIALKYGSHTLTTLAPEYRIFDSSLKNINVFIGDKKHSVSMGSIIYLKEHESIKFENISGYRVNVIGFVLPHITNAMPNESNVEIFKKDLIPSYSLDTYGKTYRAEFYHGDLFSGMIVFSFAQPKVDKTQPFQSIAYRPANHTPLKTAQSNISSTLLDFEENVRFIVSSKGVNLREMPNTQARILKKLPQNSQITLLEDEGKWSKVSYLFATQKYEGYLISSVLGESPPNIKTQNKEEKYAQTSFPKEVQIKVHAAFVRNIPSLLGEIVAKAPQGRKMQILSLSEDKKWAKIHYIFEGKNGPREINGYVAIHLLSNL